MPRHTAAELHVLKCELAGEVLRSSGSLRLRVTGWSMLPTIFPGDTLMIEQADSDRVVKGDIVLFRWDRRLFVHRVCGKCGSAGDMQIVTRGDGMSQPDPPVSSSDLLGKVSFVVRDGRCVEPGKRLGLSGSAVAALVRRSSSAARVVVGVHKMSRRSPTLALQELGSNELVIQEPHPCQS
ncbi:MAG TPA: signal peptidase I [Candidatus Sulfotelmatobacter sp.]